MMNKKKKPHRLDEAGQNVILIGVTYALLDLIEKHQSVAKHHHNGNGGMKGKRKEMIREEHNQLVLAFGFMSFIQNTDD
jgi:hypothetical protein